MEGLPLNYIMSRGGRFLISVKDEESGFGRLFEDLHFSSNIVLPVVFINRAIYGQLEHLSRVIDVTSEVQNLIKGRILELETR